MLHEFLLTERKEILALCAHKVSNIADPKLSSERMEAGLPLFYDGLIDVLRRAEQETIEGGKEANVLEHIGRYSAVQHGEESLKLGYTLSQVVHGYGSICQAITEYTQRKGKTITAQEFSYLNLCLDVGIAEAVTAYDRAHQEIADRDELQRLGFLAHELRNALGIAMMSFMLIKNGTVGAAGQTSQVVDNAHRRMRDIIDRSLTDVRLRSSPTVERQILSLLQLVSEVEAAATPEAGAKLLQFSIDVPPDLRIFADHHLMVSALGNLVQNAVKYTKLGSTIRIRAREGEGRIVIEIEDQCGGLPTGEVEELFHPF